MQAMDMPRWAQDVNPLGKLFRAAYLAFHALLTAQAGPGQDQVSAELAEIAAARMDAALDDIRTMLRAQAGARGPLGDGEQAAALQFAFAQVVDDTLLNAPWQGRTAWGEHLLEWRIFKTRSGGAQLFERIDAITRTSDRTSREIAELYLYCLTLGYAGRFRNRPQGDVELAQRRATLFAFLYPDMPGVDDPDFVLADGADATLPRVAPHRRSLAQRTRVYLIGALVLALPLIVSIAIWLALRPIIGDVTNAILEHK